MLLLCLILSFAFGSLASCPAGVRCVNKCCPHGMKLNYNGCVPSSGDLDVPNGTLVIHYKPQCPMYFLDPTIDSYTVNYNGTLSFMNLYDGTFERTEEFCLDENELNSTFVFLCVPASDEVQWEEETALQYYSLGLFFSAPFLLATSAVYAFIKQLRTLHGRCVVFHTLCLFISYICLGILQNGFVQDGVKCFVIGYAIQFFFMATFFWLNVMCFDIYWAFSGLKNLTGSVKERERKKLILYSIYAWCTPLLILIITVAVDLSPSVPANSVFKPQVGVDKCFFREKAATWIYFYLPMALIIVSNIILFGVTAFRIWSHRREAAVLKRGDSRKHDNTNDKESLIFKECHEEQLYLPWYSGPKTSTEKYLFSLYLKLFIVMGINWVMELLSSIVGGPGYLWYIPDFTNTLQGVFIFIIFVWKKRVRRLVRAKICACFGKKTISSDARTPWSGSSTRNTNSTDSTRTNNSIKMTPNNLASETTLP